MPLVGPLQNAFSDHGIQNAQAVKLVLQQRGWRAGEHTVALQVCDESSTDEYFDLPKCERTARAFARNPSVVAVVGPSSSSCAGSMLPLLNDAAGGPVALVGIGNTYLGLTRTGPGVQRGDPDRLYPTGRRSYLRTVAADDAMAAAAVLVAHRAGARRTFAIHDGDAYGQGLAGAFQAAARRAGLTPAGTARWDAEAHDYRPLAARNPAHAGRRGLHRRLRHEQRATAHPRPARRSRRPRPTHGARRLQPADRDRRGRRRARRGPDDQPRRRPRAGAAGPRAALGGRVPQALGAPPCCYAVHAGQVMTTVLDAIANSDGTRADVLRNLQRTTTLGGLVGDFRFDRFGDTTQTTIAIYRIRGGRLRYEQMLQVPRALLTRR